MATQPSPQELQKLVQDIQANLAQITGAQKRIFENALNAAKGASDEAEQLNFLLEQTSQHIDKVRGSLSYVYESFKDSVNELSKQNSYLVTQRQALSKLIKDKRYQSLDPKSFVGLPSERVKYINRILSRYKKAARMQMLREFPEIMQMQQEVKSATISGVPREDVLELLTQ